MSEVFLKVVNMSISASWLVLAVLVLRLVLKKAPKWTSVLLWGFVAFRLVCPFSIESTFSLIPSAETISEQVIAGPCFDVQTGIPQIDVPVNDYLGDRYYEGVTVPTNYGFHVITVLTIVWWAGIAAMLLYTATSYFQLRRKVDTAVLLRNNIYQSEIVDSPFVPGIVKPKIYLPFRLDTKNLELVVAHEEAHIRRKDHWWKPLGFALLAFYWFNPLMWLVYILLCRDIELACDEKVIKEMDNENRADYTQALVACSVNRRRIAACPLAFGEVGVKDRVKSVMNYKKPAFWIIVAAIISCVVVAVCFLTNPKTSANNQVSLPQDIQNPNASLFAAMVSEVHDTYLLVAPEGGSPLSYADEVEISLAGLAPALQIGETVLIVYDGNVQEVYPPRIDSAYRVERLHLDSGPVETIYGNVKTYFRNTNGTWQTGGRNYKYRLILNGRIPKATNDSVLVYLSNKKEITFEQAWKAAGYSSNKSDYFAVEDAVLVEWSNIPIDKIDHDIDGDGQNELCTLTYGPTSGLFSFRLYISSEDHCYIETYVLRSHYFLSFEVAESGQLRIRAEHTVDSTKVVYFDIAVKDGRILLQCDEEGIFLK